MKIEYAAAVAFIGVCTVFDWKRMEIPAAVIYGFLATALISVFLIKKPEIHTILYSLTPGAALLTLGFFTKESIGYGDGLAVLVLGVLLGVRLCTAAVFMGILLSAIFSIALLALHKVNGKSRIPYIPFLAAGLGVVLFV